MRLILIIAIILASCTKPTPPEPPPKPIDPCQIANAGEDKLISKGETVELGANDLVATASYLWMPKGSVMSFNTPKTKVSPTGTSIYLLKVKNSCGISYDFVKVKVK